MLQRHESVASQEEDLPRGEVIRRLRLLGQPIMLFGEVRCHVALLGWCCTAPTWACMH